MVLDVARSFRAGAEPTLRDDASSGSDSGSASDSEEEPDPRTKKMIRDLRMEVEAMRAQAGQAAHVDAGDGEAAVAVLQHKGLERVDALLRAHLEVQLPAHQHAAAHFQSANVASARSRRRAKQKARQRTAGRCRSR